jgi:hypothetical protein
MAIAASYLKEILNNPDLSGIENFMLSYLEGNFDKELYLRFTGTFVDFDRFTYFETPLINAHINKGRFNAIWAKLVALYADVGWTVTYQITPSASVIRFTPKL